MSRTLFVYIFRDMLRIFLLALLTLAVIMSFGGLLRPLTRQGLEPAQIGAALGYLLPAMMTYALPIAALFATTFVYGRLSADNEITACRAGGISYLSMVAPAFLLGLIVSIVSLLMLCFIVPGLTLKVEQLATSNVAKYIAFQIERDHEVSFPNWPYTIFAQSAYLPPQPENEQVVVLKGPMVVSYDHRPVAPALRGQTAAKSVRVPKNFWMAQQATLYISNLSDNRLRISGRSRNGTMFERLMRGDRGGTADATFGPTDIDAGVREHPKFMDIRQLKYLLANRSQSQRIQDAFANVIRQQQEKDYLAHVLYELKSAGSYRFDTGAGETYDLKVPSAISPTSNGRDQASFLSPAGSGRNIQFIEKQHGTATLSAHASQVQIQVSADKQNKMMVVMLRVLNAEVTEGSVADDAAGAADLDRRIYCPMSPTIAGIANQTLSKYLNGPDVPMNAPVPLRHEIVQLTNYIYSEMHGRVSFAVSCLILVSVGSALGLMFKSGNFLSAFAVSVAPALLAIALVATGQHVVEGVPWNVTPANDPVNLGIAIIWSGNLAALIIGAVLLGRLQRK